MRIIFSPCSSVFFKAVPCTTQITLEFPSLLPTDCESSWQTIKCPTNVLAAATLLLCPLAQGQSLPCNCPITGSVKVSKPVPVATLMPHIVGEKAARVGWGGEQDPGNPRLRPGRVLTKYLIVPFYSWENRDQRQAGTRGGKQFVQGHRECYY